MYIPSSPSKLLQVTTDYFCAGAVWEKWSGIWSGTSAAPILHWMVGMTNHGAKLALLKMGADYHFLTASELREAAHGSPDTASAARRVTCPKGQIEPRNPGGVDPSSPLTRSSVAPPLCRTDAQPSADRLPPSVIGDQGYQPLPGRNKPQTAAQ